MNQICMPCQGMDFLGTVKSQTVDRAAIKLRTFLDPFGSPYETDKLVQVTGANNSYVVLTTVCDFTVLAFSQHIFLNFHAILACM